MAALLAAGSMAVVLGWFEPIFDTSDDISMMRMASGLFSGERSEHLVFTHVAVGWVLRGLYGITTRLNWYSGYLYAIAFAGLTATFWALLARGVTWRNLLLCGVAFGVAWLEPLLRLTYTTTAIWSAIGGGLMILAAVDDDRAVRRLPLGLGVALLVIASLVRVKAMYLAVLLLAPAVLLRLWRTRSPWLAGAFAAALVAAFGLQLADRAYYRATPAWRDYMAYNAVRGQVHDTLLFRTDDDKAELLAGLGWTENDAVAMRLWLFADPQVYSYDKIVELVDGLQAAGPPRDKAWRVYRAALDETALWWIPCHLALGLIVGAGRRRDYAVLAAAMLALALGLGWYLALHAKPKNRVWKPLFDSLAVVTCLWVAGNRQSLFQRGLRDDGAALGGAAIAGALAITFGYGMIARDQLLRYAEQTDKNARAQRRLKDAVGQLQHLRAPGQGPPVFVVIGSGLELRWMSPLENGALLEELQLVTLGWATHSPHYLDSLAQHGIQDIYLDLARRDDLYLIASSTAARAYAVFLRERYGQIVYLDKPARAPHLGKIRGGIVYKPRIQPVLIETGSKP